MSRDSPPAAPALPLRLLLALLGGGAIALAFPAYDQWYAAWLGCALLAAAGWAAGFRWGLLIGLLLLGIHTAASWLLGPALAAALVVIGYLAVFSIGMSAESCLL